MFASNYKKKFDKLINWCYETLPNLSQTSAHLDIRRFLDFSKRGFNFVL